MTHLTDEEILNKSSSMQRAGSDEWCMEAWEVEDWVMEVRNFYEEMTREMQNVIKTQDMSILHLSLENKELKELIEIERQHNKSNSQF